MQKLYIEFLCCELQHLSIGADANDRGNICFFEDLRKSAWVASADNNQLDRRQQIFIFAGLEHDAQTLFAESIDNWWLVNVLKPKLGRIVGVVDTPMTVYHQYSWPFG